MVNYWLGCVSEMPRDSVMGEARTGQGSGAEGGVKEARKLKLNAEAGQGYCRPIQRSDKVVTKPLSSQNTSKEKSDSLHAVQGRRHIDAEAIRKDLPGLRFDKALLRTELRDDELPCLLVRSGLRKSRRPWWTRFLSWSRLAQNRRGPCAIGLVAATSGPITAAVGGTSRLGRLDAANKGNQGHFMIPVTRWQWCCCRSAVPGV